MGFLAPWLLAALVAVGAPLAAHLMRRRDLPVRVLPTLALLERAVAESQKRLEVRDRVLLALRLFAVVALALACARPFVREVLPLGTEAPVALALVIDDSLSMTEARGGASLLDDALARALTLARSAHPRSEISVVLAGYPARTWTLAQGPGDALERSLAAVPRASARGLDPARALSAAASAVVRSTLTDRRVVVLSDFRGDATWDISALPANVQLLTERFEGRSEARAITAASFERSAEPGAPGRLRVESVGAVEAQDLNVWFRGDALGASFQAAAPGTWVAPIALPASADVLEVGLGVRDELAADDRRWIPLGGAERRRVGVVTGDRDRTSSRSSDRFLVRALTALAGETERYSVQALDPSRLDTATLDGLDVLFALGLDAPPAGPLRAFVESGGTLAVAAGANFNPALARARWGELLPASLGDAVTESPPLAMQLPSPAAGEPLDSGPVVTERVLLDTWPTDAAVLATFADGSPAVLASPLGAGTLALVTTSLGDDGSRLPFSPVFLPLLEALAGGRPAAEDSDTDVHLGAPWRLPLPKDTVRAELERPDGKRTPLNLSRPEVTDAGEPGPYRVWIETRRAPLHVDSRFSRVVNPAPEESNLRPQTPPQTSRAEGRAAALTVKSPVTGWLVLAAALLVLAEGLARVPWRRALA